MGWGNKSLFKWSRSLDQDGCHAHIVKTFKKIFSGTKRPMTLKLSMQHHVREYYQVCSNDDLGLTLTCFMARTNLVPYDFVWENGKTMDFSETVVVCDVKVGRCSKLNEFMNLYDLSKVTQIQHIQTYSNFMQSLHDTGERKFVQMVQVT